MADKHWLETVFESAYLWGVLTLVAFAITFSPRASGAGTWLCLAVSLLTLTAMIWFHERVRVHPKRSHFTVLGAVCGAIVVIPLGLWLTQQPAGMVFQVVAQFVTGLWHWLQSPHGRWFDKLLGVLYTLVALFIVLVIAAAAILLKRRQAKNSKGFLDYRLDAETAMHELPKLLVKLTKIMIQVGPALNGHTAALLRAKSTAGQLRVSKQAAWSLDKYSMQVDRVRRQFDEKGILLSEGLVGWSNWIKTANPRRSALGTLPGVLQHFTETLKTTNDSLAASIGSAISAKGASSVLNDAIDRYAASWNAVLHTNKRIVDACNAALEVFNALS